MLGMFAAGAPPFQNLPNDASAGCILWTEFTTGSDHLPQCVIRAYNGTGSALTAGRPYILTFDGDEETNPSVAVATASMTGEVTSGSALRRVVVALKATANATWDWFAIQGYVNCLVEGTTNVAKDDYLELVPASTATALQKDAALGNTSVAIACAAQEDNSEVLCRVFLLGERVRLAGS